MESGKGIKILFNLKKIFFFLRSLSNPVQFVKSVERENFLWKDLFFGY